MQGWVLYGVGLQVDGVPCAEGRKERAGATYQSPADSARDELALVPAAAEAKDAGAMAKVELEEAGRAARRDGRRGTGLCWCGGRAVVVWIVLCECDGSD